MRNLFVSELLPEKELLELCQSHGVGVELIRYSIAGALDDLERAAPQADYPARLTLHGPFMDLNPATWDSLLRRATVTRFDQAYRAALALGAEKLVKPLLPRSRPVSP